MAKIMCPRCMPPGDPTCPYCGGAYDVTENLGLAGPREIQRLKAIADGYQRRAEDAEAKCMALSAERSRFAHMSERHFTCNGCGGSWNCEPLAERDERGCRVPSRPCPYCQYQRECAGALSQIQQTVHLQGDVKRLQKSLERWRQYALDCGGHVCACDGCGNPGLAQVEEGVWCCQQCAKKNGYEKESCL